MQPSPNPAVGLIRSFFVVFSVLLVAGCSETSEDAPAYYQRALNFVAEEQPELALVELKGALRLDPRLKPALELRLELHEGQQDYAAVVETINRLLEVDPQHLGAWLRKGELLLLGGEAEASREPIARALELAPNNQKALNLQTAWLIRNGQPQKALGYSDRALAEKPIETESYALAVIIRTRMGLLEEASSMVDAALTIHPEDAGLHLLRIGVAQAQGRFDAIPGYYDTLIALYPDELAYPRSLALFYLREDRDPEAIAVMRKAVDDNPSSVSARFLLGQLLARGSDSESFNKIEALLAEQPDTTQLRFLLARLYEDSDRYSEAVPHYETIANLEASQPEALTARAELARIALNQGRRKDAEILIDAIIEQDGANVAGLLLQAHILLLDEKVREATGLLRTVLRDEPDNDRALAALGRAYLQGNSRALAMDSFKSALDANPLNKLAAKALATLHLQDGNLEAVTDVLDPFEAAQVEDTDIERALLQARLLMKDWRGAQRLANSGRIGKNNPLFKELVSALVLQGNHQYGASIPKLKTILSKPSGNVRTVLNALVNGYAGANQLQEGVRFFEQYRQQHPDKPWSNQMLVDMYIRAEKKNSAINILEQETASNQARIRDYGRLAHLLSEAGQPERALATLNAGIAKYPDKTALLLMKAALLERLDRVPEATTTYEQLLARDPKSDPAANNLAVIYSREPETLAKAEKLVERFRATKQPYYADTRGWICVLSDDLDCGLPLLELAVKRQPQQAEFNYHLGAALVKAKQEARALQHLEKAAKLVNEGASFPDTKSLFVLLEQLGG